MLKLGLKRNKMGKKFSYIGLCPCRYDTTTIAKPDRKTSINCRNDDECPSRKKVYHIVFDPMGNNLENPQTVVMEVPYLKYLMIKEHLEWDRKVWIEIEGTYFNQDNMISITMREVQTIED